MPTYVVMAPAGRLSAERKAEVAAAVTTAHSELTGAAAYFAQVVFTEVLPGNHFIAGAPLRTDSIFVSGQIRAGRSERVKADLLRRIVGSVADIVGVSAGQVWVYLTELPAGQMVEFGRILPEPGDEAAWVAALPDGERRRLEALEADT